MFLTQIPSALHTFLLPLPALWTPIPQSKSGLGSLHRGLQSANECRSLSVNENLNCTETTHNVINVEIKIGHLERCPRLYLVYLATYPSVCASPRSGHFTPKSFCADHQLTQLVIANIVLSLFFFFLLWVEQQASQGGEAHRG